MTADEPTDEGTPATGAPDVTPAVERPNDIEAMERALAKANKEAAAARAELKAIKPLADKAQQLEEAGKSELEKLTEQLNVAKAEAAEASSARQRLDMALEKAPAGLGIEDVRWVANRAQGATAEELEADLADLFARFAPATAPATSPPAANGRPVESLRPGALPSTPQLSIQDQIAQAEMAGDHNLAGHLKTQWLAEIRAKTA